jgi:hypothetical protein
MGHVDLQWMPKLDAKGIVSFSQARELDLSHAKIGAKIGARMSKEPEMDVLKILKSGFLVTLCTSCFQTGI